MSRDLHADDAQSDEPEDQRDHDRRRRVEAIPRELGAEEPQHGHRGQGGSCYHPSCSTCRFIRSTHWLYHRCCMRARTSKTSSPRSPHSRAAWVRTGSRAASPPSAGDGGFRCHPADQGVRCPKLRAGERPTLRRALPSYAPGEKASTNRSISCRYRADTTNVCLSEGRVNVNRPRSEAGSATAVPPRGSRHSSVPGLLDALV